MNPERLASLPEHGVAWDFETHLIQPGLLAPPPVVASAAVLVGGLVEGELVARRPDLAPSAPGGAVDDALEYIERLLADDRVVLCVANGAFDLLVAAVAAARLGRDLLPAIFDAYERGRVFDVQVAEALHAVAVGALGKDPHTGSDLRHPETGKPCRYNLAVVTKLVTGRVNAKANDEYRSRYAELESVPITRWPDVARVYPVDDAVNTLECALGQAGHLPALQYGHRWVVEDAGSYGAESCADCGATVQTVAQVGPCRALRARRNLHDLAAQAHTAWAMHLGASWGFTVNQRSVDVLEARVSEGSVDAVKPFVEGGILRPLNKEGKHTRDTAALKYRVAWAYGARTLCPSCGGRCSTCCGATTVPSPKTGRPVKCGDCGATGRPKKCGDCDGTGLDLSTAPVPRTPTDGIGVSRDALDESGDEFLINYSAHTEDAKLRDVYIPFLRSARRRAHSAPEHQWTDATPPGAASFVPGPCARCGETSAAGPCLWGEWVDIPLTLRPNVVLETGRTSYDGVIQLLPRSGGVRDCIEPRPGTVFCSDDYTAGELITDAQSLIRIVGWSRLAEALNAGVAVHNSLAAQIAGISYEEFQRRWKAEPYLKDLRQAAKPANFGFPGRMGALKLVLQQRKQGPDTECAGGPADLGGGKRGYKGLRFCVLMDRQPTCGDVKITEWRRRPTPPVCRACVECAERLRAAWLRQWPEHEPYFEFVQGLEEGAVDMGAGPGVVVQHVSRRERGGATGNAIANGFFQALLADAAKSALRRASRECYDRTLRVPGDAPGTKLGAVSAYAGGPSPLYGSRIIVFQHDETISEMPAGEAHDAATRMSEVMVEELRRYCPDLAPAVEAPPALARKWYKAMEPVYENGRLVPWEPKGAVA